MAIRLENPHGQGAWRASVHSVAQSWTQLKQVSMHSMMRFNFNINILAMPHGIQDLSSLTRNGTCAPCSGNLEF